MEQTDDGRLELRAMTVRGTVSLLDELAWWDHALRQARHERPHGA